MFFRKNDRRSAREAASDQDLVGRILRDRDSGAWETLLGRYDARLLTFLERQTQDHTACEDLFQEICLEVWQHLDRVAFDHERSFETFLFRVARVRSIDFLRKRSRAKPHVSIFDSAYDSSSVLAGRLRDSAPGISTLFDIKERRGREADILVRVLRAFADRAKSKGRLRKLQLFDLLFCKALPIRETAEVVGMSRDAVKQAKKRMSDELKELARRFDPNHTLFPGLW